MSTATAEDVGFDWTANGYQRDDTGWEYHAFTVTLTVAGRTESFAWRQGLGIDTDPDRTAVLEALTMDARAGQQSFIDFCWEYGYDSDSRKAYAVWEACKRVGEQLEALFGSELPEVSE
jgi:hypothetical protein